MSKTARTTGRMQVFGHQPGGGSPKNMTSKHSMNFAMDHGQDISGIMSPDIALRDPLDHEFVLNRKMAKKYYEDQLQQKMMENRQRNQEEKEKRFKSMCDLDAKKMKAISDLKKNETMRLTGIINDRRTAEEERKKQRNDQARQAADNIIRQTKKERRIREQIA